MKEALSHILDQSVCLTRRQMKDYIAGTMLREEQHAAELHLTSCPLCSMAMEGFEEHTEAALAAIASLNSGFLKEHYDAVTPQIHLNSMAPAASMPGRPRTKAVAIPLWKTAAIAATIVLAVGAYWFINKSKTDRILSAPLLAENKASRPESPLPPKSSGVAATAPVQPKTAKIKEPIIHTPAEAAVAMNSLVADTIAASPVGAPAATPPASNQSRGYAFQKSEFMERQADPPVGGTAALSTGVHTSKNGAFNIGGGRTSGNAVIIDGIQSQPQNVYANAPGTRLSIRSKYKAPLVSPKSNTARNKDEDASGIVAEKKEAQLDNNKYAAAATQYAEVQQDESLRRGQRNRAGIQAARAYAAAGQKAKAISVLQAIISEGGPQKRVAKKMLRELQGQ